MPWKDPRKKTNNCPWGKARCSRYPLFPCHMVTHGVGGGREAGGTVRIAVEGQESFKMHLRCLGCCPSLGSVASSGNSVLASAPRGGVH